MLTAHAEKASRNGGLISEKNSITKKTAGASLASHSNHSSNGRTRPTSAGSDRPCRRHSNHACARAGEGKWSRDRKSTRLNSSHVRISYAVFCLKKKKKTNVILAVPRSKHVA